jgi:hypothetical protein
MTFPPPTCKSPRACEHTNACMSRCSPDLTVQFFPGDRVEKYTGDYQLEGTVIGWAKTSKNVIRYVVEHEPGFLHIYSAQNLRKVP